MRQGFALFAGIAPEVILDAAWEAEALGYGSFWVNHPGATDGLAVLAAPARQTQKIELGVGVIPLHTRGPEDIAAGVRTQNLPLNRLLLGVGSPNPAALSRVRDGVATLRRELQTKIVIAALGPKMCRLAGEVADGVLFNWLTPEYAKKSAELVREGAAVAGRPVPRIMGYVRVAIGQPAIDRLSDEADRYAKIPAYGANFARMGLKPVDTGIAVQTADAVAPALRKWEGAMDDVVIRAITAKDTLDETLAVLRAARPA